MKSIAHEYQPVRTDARIKSSPILPKLPKKEPEQFLCIKRGFKNSTKSCPIFGSIL